MTYTNTWERKDTTVGVNSIPDLKSWQEKLELTEQEKVGEWDIRGKEREKKVFSLTGPL